MESKLCFNHVVSTWDDMQANFFSTRIRDLVLGVAEIQKGCQAVDLGAGTMSITEALVGAGASVIAIDQSEKMLEELNQKFASKASVDPHLGDAKQLPISDKSIDRVFANMYLQHVEYPGPAIQEMKRILKSGGRLVITDLEKYNCNFLKIEQHARWPGFYRSDIRHWLKMAGFSNIIINIVSGEQCCTTFCSSREKAEIGIFLATGTA